MIKSTIKTVLFTLSLCTFSACSSSTDETHQYKSPQQVFELMNENGLDCEVKSNLAYFSQEDADLFRKMVRENISPEKLSELLTTEQNCAVAEQPSGGGVATVAQAVTSQYTVKFIPANYQGLTGNYGTQVLRDSSTYSWMCNSGWPEFPADYIMQFHLSGAYANASSLKVRGITTEGVCYLQATNATRVYSDDDARMCIGYGSWFLCSSWEPQTSDLKLYY